MRASASARCDAGGRGAQGEQHAPGYVEMNAFRQVPTLLVGDTPLTQSMAIMEYLEEAHPTPPLLPPLSEVRLRPHHAARPDNARGSVRVAIVSRSSLLTQLCPRLSVSVPSPLCQAAAATWARAAICRNDQLRDPAAAEFGDADAVRTHSSARLPPSAPC